MCWRRLLRVPWTARKSNQFILKEITPGCSLEGLMLKLKLQYFGHLMQRTDSLEKTLMLGKIEGRRRTGWQRMRWLDDITDLMDMCLSELRGGDGQGGLVCCGSWGHQESDTTEWLNWTELLKSFPGGASGEEPAWKCRRHKGHRSEPWVRKITWRRKWQPTLAFLLG